jgi:hypothetical protein
VDVTPTTSKNVANVLAKGTPIKLMNYIKLMHILGFINVAGKTNGEEDMLSDIWKLLGGTPENQIKAENLFIFLCGILNIQLPDLIQEHKLGDIPKTHTKTNPLCYDQFSNSHFICAEDMTRLHQRFFQLSVNRKARKRAEE